MQIGGCARHQHAAAITERESACEGETPDCRMVLLAEEVTWEGISAIYVGT